MERSWPSARSPAAGERRPDRSGPQGGLNVAGPQDAANQVMATAADQADDALKVHLAMPTLSSSERSSPLSR